MSASIEPVQEIKDRLPVEQLLSEYLELKPAGVNLKTVCPFHAEKTPSFMISPERRSWHCFGCNKGGDVFTFLMEMEGLEFREALQLLAKKTGVELPTRPRDRQRSKRANLLYEINKTAMVFFEANIRQLDADSKVAQAELANRKLDDLTRDTFHVGYARAEWDALTNFLTKKGYKEQDMIAAGVAVARSGGKAGSYDRFRNRLMFPLIDVLDRTVGFSARALDPNEKMGKYINSPESEIYHKGKFLYALNRAKTEIRKKNFAILVEGQMDAISSHRVGVTNAVATSGTALTTEHLQLLQRYTTNLVLAFDVDVAGASATKRGIDMAIAQGFNVKVARVPAGQDPDDLCRSDPKKWGKALNGSEAITDYYIRQTTEGKDLTKVENKKAVARAVLPEIVRITDSVEQTHYLQRVSQLLGVDESVLRDALAKVPAKSSSPGTQRNIPAVESSPKRFSSDSFLRKIARLIALRLRNNAIKKDSLLVLETLADPIIKQTYQLLSSGASSKSVLEKLPNIEERLPELVDRELFTLDKEQSNEEEIAKDELSQLVSIIAKQSLRRELTDLHRRAAQSNNDKALTADFVKKTRELAKLEEQETL